MNFSEFKKAFQKNFAELTKDADTLFEIAIDKDEFWNLYLDSFPAGTNEIFRERREHDCSCCRHFIKEIGNTAVIKNNVIHTIWEFQTGDSTYQPVINALNAYLKARAVTDMYISKFSAVGTDKNYETVGGTKVLTWEHFYLRLPDKFVDKSYKSIGDIKGSFRDIRNVFHRSLKEITIDSVETVLELIASNSLYKGTEWKTVLQTFWKYKKAYDKLSADQQENFSWENAKTAGAVVGKIRNHSIGTLLVNISEGMDLDAAVRKYEAIVAPANYKRPKAIFTKKMLEDAKKTISDLGYMDSLARRFATLDDISVNNILFSNKDVASRISGGMDVFDEMLSEASNKPMKFTRVEEIHVEKFMSDVLPTAKGIEVYLENRHSPNMVSLIAPKNGDAPSMFKWDNAFSWAYTGNITDSDVKKNVKNAGGKVDGVLRFSIQWNDEDYNPNDFDAHCKQPGGFEICYYGKRDCRTNGNLDVDIIHPVKGTAAVENITWPNKNLMETGVYKFFVDCYSNNGGRSGFKAEIEFNGEIHSFEYRNSMRTGDRVHVAEVKLDRDGNFTINPILPSDVSSREVWNLKTNQFVPVTVAMLSPNYWNQQTGIGHKHYMFVLKDCVNPENPNGYYNEFLKQELAEHKRVFEALGSKMAVESVDDQLSGIGFSSTKRNDIVVKVIGKTERIMRIMF